MLLLEICLREPLLELPKPVGTGWVNVHGAIEPERIISSAVPDIIVELTRCKCGNQNLPAQMHAYVDKQKIVRIVKQNFMMVVSSDEEEDD